MCVFTVCVLCLCPDNLLKLLNDFYKRPEVRRLAAENGLDGKHDLMLLLLLLFFLHEDRIIVTEAS